MIQTRDIAQGDRPAAAPSSQARSAGGNSLAALTDALEENVRKQRALEADRLNLISQVVAWSQQERDTSRRELEYRAARAEIAALLRISEQRAEREMSLAYDLSEQYPNTAQALAAGQLDLQHVRVIVEAGYLVGAGDDEETTSRRSHFEAAVLNIALQETPNRLQPAARRIAEHWAATPIEERHLLAAKRRTVTVVSHDDGMADLIAHISAVDANAIREHLTDIARASARAMAKDRKDPSGTAEGKQLPGSEGSEHPAKLSLDQLRADALRDLLLSSPKGRPHQPVTGDDSRNSQAPSAGAPRLQREAKGENVDAASPPKVRAHVEIVIPFSALTADAGASEGVCELRGYGPMSSTEALRLAAASPTWNRVFTDDATGGVIAVDRYRPSEQMRRTLAARDGHCRFPGCRVPTRRCDIDHTVDAARGGSTATDNLAHLCRGHHTLKHHSDWQPTQGPGGVLTWKSPTGRSYTDRPREHLPERRSQVRFTEA
ncbi:HNH endonuclease signature motif containing protein [Leucobacter komagatae]|uniref:HNH endonuclease signature motif containing protein n=1 Tax=Leucobacter komagatae TaxID=55969 RepID=UPI0006973FDA|nr:HNH endonuclease signature motif containing protein [Leucobacter komagatae]